MKCEPLWKLSVARDIWASTLCIHKQDICVVRSHSFPIFTSDFPAFSFSRPITTCPKLTP